MKLELNLKVKIIDTIIILISIATIYFEIKAYTPIDKDESIVIENYDEITNTLQAKIRKEKEYENYLKSVLSPNQYIEIKNVYKTLNYKNQTSEKYGRMLIELCLKENSDTPAHMCGIAEAWEIDLNQDGTNEIIGFVNDSHFYGSMGRRVYILQKTKNGYKNLNKDYISHKAGKNIEILTNKTNEFFDIRFYSAVWDDTIKPLNYVTQFKNGGYFKSYRFE